MASVDDVRLSMSGTDVLASTNKDSESKDSTNDEKLSNSAAAVRGNNPRCSTPCQCLSPYESTIVALGTAVFLGNGAWLLIDLDLALKSEEGIPGSGPTPYYWAHFLLALELFLLAAGLHFLFVEKLKVLNGSWLCGFLCGCPWFVSREWRDWEKLGYWDWYGLFYPVIGVSIVYVLIELARWAVKREKEWQREVKRHAESAAATGTATNAEKKPNVNGHAEKKPDSETQNDKHSRNARSSESDTSESTAGAQAKKRHSPQKAMDVEVVCQ